MAATPISMIVRRLQWSDIAAAMKPPMQIVTLAATASRRICSGVMCSGALASTSNEPVIAKS